MGHRGRGGWCAHITQFLITGRMGKNFGSQQSFCTRMARGCISSGLRRATALYFWLAGSLHLMLSGLGGSSLLGEGLAWTVFVVLLEFGFGVVERMWMGRER